MKIRVTSIQRGCVYDGPGVRTTIFLKGCTMACPWCCNPETISPNEEYFIDSSKCLFLNGTHSRLCEPCVRVTGDRSITECPFGVATAVSTDYTSDELYEIISKDFSLMQSSGGGVTFSGGEPLLQIDALIPLLGTLKENGIPIAFETTLTTSGCSIHKAADYADIAFVDLKLQSEHSLYLNVNYKTQLQRNIDLLREKKIGLVFRLVFVDSMNNEVDSISSFLSDLNIVSFELLKCHNLALNKYKKLNKKHISWTPLDDNLNEFIDRMYNKGFEIIVNTL